MKIAEAAAEGQDHHHQGRGHAQDHLADALTQGQGPAAGVAHAADPSPSLHQGPSLVPAPNRGDVQSQNPGRDHDPAPHGLRTPGQGPGPDPPSRIENPGLTPNPSPRLNHFPRSVTVLVLAQSAKAVQSLAA